jgi:hypothetical protein
MPIGEDVPMLIPISIVLVVFILFLFTLFTNFSEQSEIVRMSQTSLNIGERLINIKFATMTGINGTLLGNIHNCANYKISALDISSNYKVMINITDKVNQSRFWCWGTVKDAEEVVTNRLPTLIIENNKTIPAMVVISIGK